MNITMIFFFFLCIGGVMTTFSFNIYKSSWWFFRNDIYRNYLRKMLEIGNVRKLLRIVYKIEYRFNKIFSIHEKI